MSWECWEHIDRSAEMPRHWPLACCIRTPSQAAFWQPWGSEQRNLRRWASRTRGLTRPTCLNQSVRRRYFADLCSPLSRDQSRSVEPVGPSCLDPAPELTSQTLPVAIQRPESTESTESTVKRLPADPGSQGCGECSFRQSLSIAWEFPWTSWTAPRLTGRLTVAYRNLQGPTTFINILQLCSWLSIPRPDKIHKTWNILKHHKITLSLLLIYW